MASSSRTPSNFGAAAIGEPPIVNGTNASGMAPAFPSTDALRHASYKVVVASWRRLNEANTNTADFAVNISSYARKVSPVTRVQLVDIDLPCTQQLIEPQWARLYFGMGGPTGPQCRTLELAVENEAAPIIVTLPLLLQFITSYEKLPGNTVRLYTELRAPWPIAGVAEAWRALGARGCGCLQLVNVPGLGTYQLLPDEVYDDTPFSFDVRSSQLYAALPSTGGCPLYLHASPVPGPGFLATILSRLMLVALAKPLVPLCQAGTDVGVVTCGDQDAGYVSPWMFDLNYDMLTDRYTLGVRAGYRHVCPLTVRVTLGGPLAVYMGFGDRASLEVPTQETIAVPARNARTQGPAAFADVACGSPKTGVDLAACMQLAFNRYAWPAGGSFVVTTYTPAQVSTTVPMPSGHMTLYVLAQVLTATLAGLGLNITATLYDTKRVSGIAFEAAEPVTYFSVSFLATQTGTLDPVRLGYDARTYPAACAFWPVRHATHLPMFSCCGEDMPLPPMSDVSVTYRPDTEQLVLQTVPFPPFPATLVADSTDCHAVTFATATPQGLLPGAQVVVATGAATQYWGIVIDIDPPALQTTVVLPLCPPLPAGAVVTVIPQDSMPLNLFLQRQRPAGFPTEIIGFQPRTYETCCDLVSPGTIDLNQDPFVLLCLGFDSPEAEPTTGDVYYPYPTPMNTSNLVFAKVLRNAAFKSDFEKVFDHAFPGAGTIIGYIRVRVLNPDGTLYQTHGHNVSITLKFDVRESYVEMGAGHVSVYQKQGAPSSQFTPLGRSGAVISHAQTMGAASIRRR